MNTLYVENREDWREWLQANHATETEVWLVFYKKHTGRPRVAYADSVEEALCFGWIDSVVRTLDDERYAQRFSPRKPKSNWSELNKRRVKKLLEAGLMTQAGLDRVTFAVADVDLEEQEQRPGSETAPAGPEVPYFVKQGLMANARAWENFNKLASSYQGNYVKWIMAASREETRRKRLTEAIELLEQNKKLGLK